MTINLDTIKHVLGSQYDPTKEYLVTDYGQKIVCEAKGYKLVGNVQDPSPEDREMLIYEKPRHEPPPPPKETPRVEPPKETLVGALLRKKPR